MQIKRIKCPNCGALLDVRNSQNESVKIVTCPQCKAGLRVHFAATSTKSGSEANTHLPSGHSQAATSHGDTQLGHKPQSMAARPRLVCGGRSYPLAQGINIVGRRAATSQATVQIATDDHYMSRSHARIDITPLPGGGLKAVIRNDKNKNATTVAGQLLADDDALILKDGTLIVMGKTSIEYKEQ